MKKGLYQEALNDCSTLLSIDEKNVGAYYILGNNLYIYMSFPFCLMNTIFSRFISLILYICSPTL
jgi:hypothetical protein